MNVHRRGKFLASFFGLVSAFFLVLMAFAFVLLRDHQDNLAQQTYDETGMAAVQVRLHYEALMGSLALVEARRTRVAVDNAVTQFDILYERLKALPNRPSYELLLNEETLGIQAEVLKTLTVVLPQFDLAAEGDAEALDAIHAQLAPLRQRIERLAHSPVHIASELRASITKNFENIAAWFSWVIIGLFVSGVTFALIIWRQQVAAIHRHRELEQLTENLKMARDAAEAANVAKSNFLATMSHELRTPLTSIKGALGLMNSMMSDDFTGQTKELFDVALRNSDTMLMLINELLDYEKIISGTMIIKTRPHDICALTKQVVEDNQGYANAQSVTFNFTEPEEPLFAEVQEHRFEQILRNLLSNAAKFSALGSEVEIAVNRVNGSVVVSVKDYGSGIPEDFKTKIFEQFTQVDSSSTRKHAGTGLGLSISKLLAEGMGGTLSFESEGGIGSTFFITLSASE